MRRLAVFWVLSALVVACASGERGPAVTPETAPAVPAIAATPAAAPEGTATPPPALLSPHPGVLAVVSPSSARPAVHALHPATGEDLPWDPAGPMLDWPNLVSPDGRYMAVGGGSSWSRLRIVDLATLDEQFVGQPRGARWPSWGPEGRYLYAATDECPVETEDGGCSEPWQHAIWAIDRETGQSRAFRRWSSGYGG